MYAVPKLTNACIVRVMSKIWIKLLTSAMELVKLTKIVKRKKKKTDKRQNQNGFSRRDLEKLSKRNVRKSEGSRKNKKDRGSKNRKRNLWTQIMELMSLMSSRGSTNIHLATKDNQSQLITTSLSNKYGQTKNQTNLLQQECLQVVI